MDALTYNSAIEIMEIEARGSQDEIVALHLANEVRFGTPIGACPWGCDGSGWRELAAYCWPMIEIEIRHGGRWLTLCGCNVVSTHLRGVHYRWPRRYPPDYTGEQIGLPDLAV